MVFVFLSAQAVRVMVDYWLSVWVDREYHLSTKIYVISYACFTAGAIIFSLARALLFTEAAMLSSKQMHGRMAERVLRSPQLFFDQVYIYYLYSSHYVPQHEEEYLQDVENPTRFTSCEQINVLVDLKYLVYILSN